MENMTIPEFDEIIIGLPEETNEITQDQDVDITDDQTNNDDDIIIVEEQVEKEVAQTEEKVYSDKADPVAVATFDQLLEKGVFTDEDRQSFDGTWEKMEEKFEQLPQRILNDLVAQASDYSKDLVRFAFSSPNISRDDLIEFAKTYADETESPIVQLETMDDARSYMEQVLTAKGNKPRAVEAILNTLEEDGTLMDDAKEEYEKEKENKANRPKTEKMIADKENEEIQRVQNQTRFAASLNEELSATGWKPSKINEIKQRLNTLNPILQDVFKSPKALVKFVDFLGYYNNGDIDYSTFQQSVETPKAKQFQTRMQEAIDSPTLSTKSNLKDSTTQDNLRPVI